MPKLLLINPVNTVNIFSFLNPKRSKNNAVVFVPPIGLGYIATLTPDNWDVKLIDEAVTPFKYERADLVGITATTGQAPRAYEIATIYKSYNTPVIMGGIHASFCTVEASKYVDSIVTGEVEEVWPEVLKDFDKGLLKPVYYGKPADLKKKVIPDRTIFSNKYKVGSIMTSRGCPFFCEFCSVSIFNGSYLRRRNIEDVVEELKTSPQRFILFLDDNLIGYSENDKKYVIKLLEKIIASKVKKKWACQSSINSLNDDRILLLAKKAGCVGFFVGIESVNENVLKRMGKKANLQTGIKNYKDCIKKIHRYGMVIMGNFIMGYEKNVNEINQDTYWMKRSTIDIINFSILTPYPGTRIYEKLNEENRILLRDYPFDWGLYDADHPVFQFDHLSLDDIHKGIKQRINKIYSYRTIIWRFIKTTFYTRNMLHSLIALFVNIFWTRRKNIARLVIINLLMERKEYKQV